MTALDKFNEWLLEQLEDQYHQTWGKTRAWLIEQGFTEADIINGLKGIRYWLAKNEGSPKVNKKHWSKFIKNWFQPKEFYRNSARLTPSKFND